MAESDDTSDNPPPPEVSRDLFLAWRAPRVGRGNPQMMTNPVWVWLIESKIRTYQANKPFDGPSVFAIGPGWCFDRFGQSSTTLPDGRTVLIAGEYEDYYDPDFYIYNDVVVQDPDGGIEIYGYTQAVFPATDFHSATLVGDRIILIGNLGYYVDRRYGTTQVLALELESFSISSVQTSGPSPGWIHDHNATLAEDGRSILIERGKVDRGDDSPLVENIDDWRLHLDDWRWERLTDRQWPRWEVRRSDGEFNHLSDYEQAISALRFPEIEAQVLATLQEALGPDVKYTFRDKLGREPDLDLFGQRYKPPIQHEEVPGSVEEFKVYRVKIDGVVVRYVEDMDGVQLTVEGQLPRETLDVLTRDLVEKMSALEFCPCELIEL